MSDRITTDEFGNMKIEGIYLSVKDNSYKVSDNFKKAVKDIEIQLKHAAISEEQYYKKMESLRDTYLEKGTKEWWSYTNKIISYEEKLVKEQQKLVEEEMKNILKVYTDISSKIYKTQEDVLKAQEKFKDKLKGDTELFGSIKQVFYGMGENGTDIVNYKFSLSDLDAKKKELSEYYGLLKEVQKRGEAHFSEDGFRAFFEEIRGLSVTDAVTLTKLLLSLKDEEFEGFISDFKDIGDMTERFAEDLYKKDTEDAINESFNYMKLKLAEAGMEIPDGFYTSGSVSAEKFAEGFVSQIDGLMADITKGFENIMPKNDVLLKAQSRAEEKGSVFAPVYNLYGSGETINQKLRTAHTQAMLEKLRGGY